MVSERATHAGRAVIRPGAAVIVPASSGCSASIASLQSPQIRWASGFAHAFRPHAGQVYLVLLAAFFLRVAASPSPARSW